MPNTLDCHRLIVWAQGQGLGSAMEERLFRAYFEEGADLTRLDVLADLAAEAGLQRDIVASLLAGDAERARIIADCETAGAMGVTGVPAMILNRRFKVLGAQAPQVLADAFDRVMRPDEAITG
jgi:predicted DsbA family dithiol-disulfide isomerase